MRTLAIMLVVTVGAAPVRAEDPPTSSKRIEETTLSVEDPGAGQKRFALGLAIGGGVLLASSFVLSAVASHRYDNCVDEGGNLLTEPGSSCPYSDPAEARLYANDQRWLAKGAGTSLFISGVAVLGTALVLRMTAPKKRRTVRIDVAPTATASTVGFSLSGGF